jgi:hypothetical protein
MAMVAPGIGLLPARAHAARVGRQTIIPLETGRIEQSGTRARPTVQPCHERRTSLAAGCRSSRLCRTRPSCRPSLPTPEGRAPRRPSAPPHPLSRDRLACRSARPERGVPRTGTRLRLAARSLRGRRITGVSRRSGSPRGLGPAAGEAGGGRTSAPPAEVALIVPMRHARGVHPPASLPGAARADGAPRGRRDRVTGQALSVDSGLVMH